MESDVGLAYSGWMMADKGSGSCHVGSLKFDRVLQSKSRTAVGSFDLGLSFDVYGDLMDKTNLRPSKPCAEVLDVECSKGNHDCAVSGWACDCEFGGISSPEDLRS